MKLTRTERLILSLQYKILEQLDKHEADYYRRAREAVESGYEAEYNELAQNVYNKTLSVEDCRFVWEVMGMYDALQRGQKKSTAVKASEVKLPGFDGNNETALMGYARYIVEKKDEYSHLDKVPDLNSHMPSADTYQRMLDAWNASKDKYDLAEDDVARILDARTHPSHRAK